VLGVRFGGLKPVPFELGQELKELRQQLRTTKRQAASREEQVIGGGAAAAAAAAGRAGPGAGDEPGGRERWEAVAGVPAENPDEWGWHGVGMGLAGGWHGVGMGLAWGWHGAAWGSHGVRMGFAWGLPIEAY
jgi:hypothetical protein